MRTPSPTACSTSTLGCDDLVGRGDEAPRAALRDLRPRRNRVADPRRPPTPALHALPRHARLREDRDRRRADDGARDRPAARHLERVLPLLLRLERPGATNARR